MRVQTVVGEIDSANLGRTLVHEHLFAKWPGPNSIRRSRSTAAGLSSNA
jgi:predicted metal-dependent phosphotriesterase family hydrolase